MATDPNEPGEDFAEGQDDPEEFPEDEKVGRFSTGDEELPGDDPEKHRVGRFSEGTEELGEDDPEKQVEGSFADEDD
jgi:hypothetical protein